MFVFVWMFASGRVFAAVPGVCVCVRLTGGWVFVWNARL